MKDFKDRVITVLICLLVFVVIVNVAQIGIAKMEKKMCLEHKKNAETVNDYWISSLDKQACDDNGIDVSEITIKQ